MFVIYDLIFIIFMVFSMPYLCIKGKFHKGLFKRFYLSRELADKLKTQNPIWIHAVSVGEVIAVRGFVETLKNDTDKLIMVSTITPTGNRLAKSILGDKAIVIYYPVDLSFIVRHFIKLINPCIFIAVETEIWPNLTYQLKAENIPIVVINGRISDDSFKGYKLVRVLLKNILRKIDMFCVQSQVYADRLAFLGAEKEKIKITGNMKFDNIDYSVKEYQAMVSAMIRPGDPLFIAGSTHKSEERIVLTAYKNLLNTNPDLQLIIAPRHIERVKEIERIVEEFGFVCVRLSQKQDIPASQTAVFVLDTIGDLTSLYSKASVVFVGGSFVKSGGHNIIEPAIFAKPIIFGPYMFNFKDISELFLSKKAAIMVNNGSELESTVKELLGEMNQRDALGQRARMVINENKGATQKNLEFIKSILTHKCR